ncbi:MAG: hypothetical protein HZA20_11145 [Nitrospirae bacterium]|nr:hypothetical protein [Nitrospirota bacterium]
MRYLLVTIDTEEDMPRWRPEQVTTVRNIAAIPALQDRLNRAGIRPTWLVDYPVLDNHESCAVIRNLPSSDCEIGMHLHSWNTPPFAQDETGEKATYLHVMPADLKRQKLAGLHAMFADKIGIAPTSYRAGRYGFCLEDASLLAELGFVVDSSVVPHTDYSSDGGPDFRSFTYAPFIIEAGNGRKIVETPLTVGLAHRLPEYLAKRYFSIPGWTRMRGVLHRLGLASLLWLRPTVSSFEEMKRLADHLLEKTDCKVINIMFHSNECFPGASPYHKTDDDVARFLERFSGIAGYLVSRYGLAPVTLGDHAKIVLAEAREGRATVPIRKAEAVANAQC